MQLTEFFDGVNFKDVSDQINAFFAANPAAVGVSVAIQVYGTRCQCILLYTP